MSTLRMNGPVEVAADANLRDLLFTVEGDPYVADRNEIVSVWLTQETAGTLLVSVLAGARLFADQITPARTNVPPITTQQPPIVVGLLRGERLKLPVLNTTAAAFDINYIISSVPA